MCYFFNILFLKTFFHYVLANILFFTIFKTLTHTGFLIFFSVFQKIKFYLTKKAKKTNEARGGRIAAPRSY